MIRHRLTAQNLRLVQVQPTRREPASRSVRPCQEPQPRSRLHLHRLRTSSPADPRHPAPQMVRPFDQGHDPVDRLRRRGEQVRRVDHQRCLEQEQVRQDQRLDEGSLAVLPRDHAGGFERRPLAVVAFGQDHIDDVLLPRVQVQPGGCGQLHRLTTSRGSERGPRLNPWGLDADQVRNCDGGHGASPAAHPPDPPRPQRSPPGSLP